MVVLVGIVIFLVGLMVFLGENVGCSIDAILLNGAIASKAQ
jgi:hypothetical protein